MVITRLVIVERRVLKGSLHKIPEVHNFLTVTGLSGRQEVKSHIARWFLESSARYIWKLSEILWTGEQIFQIGPTQKGFSFRLLGGHFSYLHLRLPLQWSH